MRPCAIEGCDRKHYARGWCQLHYVRWYRYGDPGGLEIQERVRQHGTYSEYGNFGCRCDPCRAAAAEYQKQLQATPCAAGCGRTVWGRYKPGRMCHRCASKQREKPMAVLHGTEVGYTKRGCRCERCRRASREARYRRRHANWEASQAYDRAYYLSRKSEHPLDGGAAEA